MVCTLLSQKQQLLQQHLGLCFSPDGKLLVGIPQLIEGHLPDLTRLPQLLLVLARDVVWDEEQACCRSLAQALAGFYALEECLQLNVEGGEGAAAAGAQPAAEQDGGLAVRGGVVRGGLGGDGGVTAEEHGTDAAAAGAGQGRAGSEALWEQVRGDSQAVSLLDQDRGTGSAAAQSPEGGGGGTAGSAAEAVELLAAGQAVHRDAKQRESLVRHVLCPLLRCHYKPPKGRAKDGAVVLLTSLEKLYRVFERCR